MILPEKVDKGGSLVEAKELSENLLSVSKHFSRFSRGSSSAVSLWIRDSVQDDMDAIKKHVTCSLKYKISIFNFLVLKF